MTSDTPAGRSFSATYAAARRGDPMARERLLARQSKALQSFIARRMSAGIRKQSQPEDVFQETVMIVLRRLPGFPADLTEEEFNGRLYKIAQWRIADVLRKAHKEKVGAAAGSPSEPATPTTTGPVTKSDDRRRLREILATLPETYAIVLKLCHLEGRTVAEAAKALGLTTSGVRQRLVRARAMLREKQRKPR